MARTSTGAQAKQYCAAKGKGWQLPSVDELAALYDNSLAGTQCGGYTCEVSRLFHLTNNWFWGSMPKGSGEAWGVYLTYGQRYWYAVSYTVYKRALCVRRT